jgi:hypothetical protein
MQNHLRFIETISISYSVSKIGKITKREGHPIYFSPASMKWGNKEGE